jgi:hypothetical protein
MIGHPALRLLIRLKARAALRAQLRRMKRPLNALFTLIGFALVAFWFGAMWMGGVFRQASLTADRAELQLGAEVALLFLCTMTVIGSFHHRGLYLPKEEIELCFSAPVSRSDLVRYRLLVGLLRSSMAGLLIGLGAARRMPIAGFAIAGTVVTMLTVPILGQASALLLGDVENRWSRIAKRLPLRTISTVLGALFGLGVLWVWTGRGSSLEQFLGLDRGLGISLRELHQHPVVHTVLAPFRPWASMVTARTMHEFLPWFGLCAAVWIIGFELTARVPIDFRELSLATSADVAKRLSRLRRGGIGAGAGGVSKDSRSWRVPWAFGRGRFGAIAWLKLAAIVRKARGTLLLSTAIVAFVTLLFTTTLGGSEPQDVVTGAALMAMLGTVYLCTGLRFDFRQDLEQMELVKSWPLHPALVFLATILPEIALVSLLLALAIGGRAFLTGHFHPLLAAICAFQPLVTLAWVALDNAVYLYSPVRYVPGQEGALQHMGRSILLMMLRVTLFAFVFTAMALPVAAVLFVYKSLGGDILGASLESALVVAGAVSWTLLLAIDGGLILAGGAMLRRFDVARDKG